MKRKIFLGLIIGIFGAGMIGGAHADTVLHYSFDTLIDNTFVDCSGNGNDAILGGGVQTTSRSAFGGGAFEGDGRGGVFLDTPIRFEEDEAWSVSWWSQKDSFMSKHGMVMGTPNTKNDFIWLAYNAGGSNYGLNFRNSSNETKNFQTDQDSNLHHHVLTSTGTGIMAYYLDNQMVQSNLYRSGTAFNIEAIGSAYSGYGNRYYFDGMIDEVWIFDEAIDKSIVDSLHNNNSISAPVPIPAASWLFGSGLVGLVGVRRKFKK